MNKQILLLGFYGIVIKNHIKLQIECTDSSVLLLESNYPFKIYNSYNDVHKNTPLDSDNMWH